MLEETCLNRFLGRCENCSRDYENHYPNNYDCKNYKGIKMITHNIIGELNENFYNKEEK